MSFATLVPRAVSMGISARGELPLELVIEIAERGVADIGAARNLAHVCSWTRKLALPQLYRTLAPLTSVHRLCAFPDHLKPYLRNVWLDDPMSLCASCSTMRNISWVWSTVFNIAFSYMFLDASAEHAAETPASSPVVRSVTLYDDRQPDSIQMLSWGSMLPQLASVTHMRFHAGYDWNALHLNVHMDSLQFVALAADNASFPERVIFAMVLLMRRQDIQMIVLVIPPSNDLATWTHRVTDTKWYHENLFVVPSLGRTDEPRAEWEDDINEKEDIWQRARRFREAVENGNRNEIEKMCTPDTGGSDDGSD